MTYDEIRSLLQTGDIVLFSGKGGISEWIKFGSGSKWSHVGMVMRLAEVDLALLWESTTLSTIADIVSGEKRQGVQLVPLSQRLASYDGEVSIRHIRTPLIQSQQATLATFRREMSGRPYEQSKLQLVRALFDSFGKENTVDLSSLFCSELVAEAFQRMGLLSGALPSNEFTPADFSDGAKVPILTHGPEILLEAA